ncbi:MAG: hypothetical protein LBP95_14645 [Deltaproteobacteria bacterium]|jgi:hypothetical protein|nr:hypothetical protein [Deltaproteobacteria bacterium]
MSTFLMNAPNRRQYAAAESALKSKAWVSRRVKIAKSPRPMVRQLAIKKLISVKTAGRMANLPTHRQPDFARNVLEAGLGDNEVSALARR